MITLNQLLLSILVNAAALVALPLIKTAPPRISLYVCLVGMWAIIIPWSAVGTEVKAYIPHNVTIDASLPKLEVAPEALTASHSSIINLLVITWLVVSAVWLAISLSRSKSAKNRLRSHALCGKTLIKHADPSFHKQIRRVRFYRIPNSSSALATGVRRPEIWIGNDIKSPYQLTAAVNHELAHIAANDQITLFLIVALERLLWWNPLIWLLGYQARQQMEYACDARCQSILDAPTYRRSLAALFLAQQPSSNLALNLINKSNIITRMEKIEMKHTLKANHIMTLTLAGALTMVASSTLAEQHLSVSPTLIECHKLLPKGVKYDFNITSKIDTREGKENNLSVSINDPSKPDSQEIPKGAGGFLQCVQKVLGVGNNKGWPKS
jgi:beta-lactamase regulating signal transducer with metallopeptidase domain